MERIAYINGTYVPLSEARVSILDRGFLFADSIYEVSAVIDGRLVDNDAHLARLFRSAEEIDLNVPLSAAEIESAQLELIEKNQLTNGMVYLQVTRGAAERNFQFSQQMRATIVMFTQTKDIVASPGGINGVAVKTVDDIRWQRRDIKSIGLLAQVMAKQQAAQAGCDEAWMVEDGYVTEGASSSAFIITADNVLVTRPDSHAILPGCTARAIIELSREEKLELKRRSFTVAEAMSAREAFMTSASTFVQPVVKIDGQPIGDGQPGPLVRRLREIYVNFARGGTDAMLGLHTMGSSKANSR